MCDSPYPCDDQQQHWPTRTVTRELVERTLGFRILRWPGEYLNALTHKSAVGLPGAGGRSFEKLEFLGDSILGFVVGRNLYDAYPDACEGQLTQLRTKLVSGQALSGIAQRMALADLVLMSPKALRQNFHTNPRILEDVFEALVAAVFLDAGMAAARSFILMAIETHIDRDSLGRNTNYKDQLMQLMQARRLALPVYEATGGLPDAKTFVVYATVQGGRGTGRGLTKRAAEQDAARDALLHLGVMI